MGDRVTVIEVGETRLRTRLSSFIGGLRERFRGRGRKRHDEFECILEIGHSIARRDPRALPSLIKLIGRSTQARAMTAVLRHAQDAEGGRYEPVMLNSTEPVTYDGRTFDALKRETTTQRELKLGEDLLLPHPWQRERIVSSLCGLRAGGEWGEWRQDWNHSVELWVPLGVGWVIGGNHSLTAGIVRATGVVRPEIAYDISDVYDHVACDGSVYRRTHDGSIIERVVDLELAAVFEIGRLMREHQIGY